MSSLASETGVIVDRKYYEVAGPGTLAERLLITARDAIFEDFLRLAAPGRESRILDVGVSDVLTDGANVLERKYPHLQNVVACGVGECTEFQKAFPAVAFRQIEPNSRLPFDDGEFDVAASNAVLEHVGSYEHQLNFLSELRRVARCAFVSVPNRFFPIEHHTAIPILHFSDLGFTLACSILGKQSWLEPENLLLMSRRKLSLLGHAVGHRFHVGYTGLRLGPFSSNLFIFLD